jgi:hypothetical protein
MSKTCQKIKYKEEGAFGSTEERTLFCIADGVSDYTSFYDDKGNYIFSFPDTLSDNIFEKMAEIINNWKDNPNIETMTTEEYKKCRP